MAVGAAVGNDVSRLDGKEMDTKRTEITAELALREIAALVDVSTISTNAHDRAMTLTQIRNTVNSIAPPSPDVQARAREIAEKAIPPEQHGVIAYATELIAAALATQGVTEDFKEACRIAAWMANTFYPEQEFALLPTLSGVLSQIDNMNVGVYERSVAAPAPVGSDVTLHRLIASHVADLRSAAAIGKQSSTEAMRNIAYWQEKEADALEVALRATCPGRQ